MEQSEFTGTAAILGSAREVRFDGDGLLICDGPTAKTPLTCAQAFDLVRLLESGQPADAEVPDGSTAALLAIAQELDVEVAGEDRPSVIGDACCEAIQRLQGEAKSACLALGQAAGVRARAVRDGSEALQKQARIDELEEAVAQLKIANAAIRDMSTPPQAKVTGVPIDMLDIDVRVPGSAGQIELVYGQQKHLLSAELSRRIAEMLLADHKNAKDAAYQADVAARGVEGSLEPQEGSKAGSAAHEAPKHNPNGFTPADRAKAAQGEPIPFATPAPDHDEGYLAHDKPGGLSFTGELPKELTSATKLSAVLCYLRDVHKVEDLDGLFAAVNAIKSNGGVACINRISEDLKGRVERAMATAPFKVA